MQLSPFHFHAHGGLKVLDLPPLSFLRHFMVAANLELNL
jgi:hypothetical protein